MINTPKNALSGEEAKAIVIAKYPSAVAKLDAGFHWKIYPNGAGYAVASAPSEAEAWIEAAKNRVKEIRMIDEPNESTISPCQNCNGTGKIDNPAWEPGIGCEPATIVCPVCNGSGKSVKNL